MIEKVKYFEVTTPPRLCNCSLCKAPAVSHCRMGLSNLKVCYNKFPYDKGSLLLISEDFRWQSEVIQDDLANLLYFQSLCNKDSEGKRLYLFYNQDGTGSTIEHFHIQGIIIDDTPLPIEVAPTKELMRLGEITIAKILEYPIYVLSIYGNERANPDEIARVAFGIVQIVEKSLDTPYNLSISHKTIRVIPRRGRTGYEVPEFLKTLSGDPDYAARIAGLEVSGMFIVSHKGLYSRIRALIKSGQPNDFFWKALAELGYTEEQQKKLEEQLHTLRID